MFYHALKHSGIYNSITAPRKLNWEPDTPYEYIYKHPSNGSVLIDTLNTVATMRVVDMSPRILEQCLWDMFGADMKGINFIHLESSDLSEATLELLRTIEHPMYSTIVIKFGTLFIKTQSRVEAPFFVANNVHIKVWDYCGSTSAKHTLHIKENNDENCMDIRIIPPIFFRSHGSDHIKIAFSKDGPCLKTGIRLDNNAMKDTFRNHRTGEYFNIYHSLKAPLQKCRPKTDLLLIDFGKAIKQHYHQNVCKIQNIWKRAISDPNYTVCRKRLMSEANELCAI